MKIEITIQNNSYNGDVEGSGKQLIEGGLRMISGFHQQLAEVDPKLGTLFQVAVLGAVVNGELFAMDSQKEEPTAEAGADNATV